MVNFHLVCHRTRGVKAYTPFRKRPKLTVLCCAKGGHRNTVWYTTWRQKICVTNLCTRRRSGRILCTSEQRCFDAESFRRPRANDRGSISALFEWRGIGGQRLPPMARAFCAMLSVSTRCRWSPRACHPGAVDVLRPRGLGRVSRT
jgi:hypothetical protein